MRALVTGATGFLGSHLVEALVSGGHQVTALVRSPGKASLLTRLDVRQVRGDLHDSPALVEAARGQDVIYHVAGAIAAANEADFLAANRDGTRNLVEAAVRSGSPRFLLVSSMAAGGPAERGRPRRGDEPDHPVTRYGRSKLAGEAVVRGSSLSWTIVRPPIIYGPRDYEVLKIFKLARAGIVPMFGSGDQELSAVYAPDLAQALILAGSTGKTVAKTYYACHPEIFTTIELVKSVATAVRGAAAQTTMIHLPGWLARVGLSVTGAVAALTGKPTILTPDKANEFFQPAWTGDPSPLTEDTGWIPVYGRAEGLALTAAWYQSNGWM
jgi:nucleoside-diphosphate-sugar epimerase